MQKFTQEEKSSQKTELTGLMKTHDALSAAGHDVGSLLHLQRSLGNQALWRMRDPEHVELGLKIGAPSDRYEEEADQIANQIMEMPDSASHRKSCSCGKPAGHEDMCQDCRREQLHLQRKSTGESAETVAPLIVQQALRQPGQPLDTSTRNFMESRFGYSFGHVQLHTGPLAEKSACAVQARAYTVGNHIVFNSGQYSPSTRVGKQLLAHELSHILQQSSDVTYADSGGLDKTVPSPATLLNKSILARKPVSNAQAALFQMEIQKQPGFITVTYNGVSLLTVRYTASAGAAQIDHFRNADGSEWVQIVLPPNANARYNLDSSYNQLRASGELAFMESGSETDDGFNELTGPTYGLSTKPSSKTLDQAPPKHVAPVSKPSTPPPGVSLPKGKEEKFLEKTPDQLIDEHSTLKFLDEEKLGAALLPYALQGKAATVHATLEKLDSTDRDDVSVAFAAAASDKQLAQLARTEEGRKLLLRLYDELTQGQLGEDEAIQADRILKARAQEIAPEKFVEAENKAMVIPFSSVGFTKVGPASLTVKRLENGKISVKTHMKVEHWRDAKRLPTKGFAYGLESIELDPDEVVGLHLYDEGGKVIYVPALYLLQLGNQEDTKVLTMAGEALATGATLGLGGGTVAGEQAAAGTWARRASIAARWAHRADRTAMAFGAASILINDHRGLIIKHFGKNGEEFLRYWGTVERVVAIYGMARGAVALGQTVNALRTSYQNWRAMRGQVKNLATEEQNALDDIARQAESSIKELEDAQRSAVAAAPKGVNEETSEMLANKPELRDALAKNPRAANALTLCKSPCIPEFASAPQVSRIEKLLADAERRGLQLDESRLKEYFHGAANETELSHAIDDFEQSMRKAQPGGTSTTAEAIMDEAELLQQHGVRKGKPVSVRLAEAQEGNLFDTLEGQKYPHNQVPIRDKAGIVRRLDSYDPDKGEIISRKSLAAGNGQIAFTNEFTMIEYFQEFALKYPNGAIIADTATTRKLALANKALTGKYILEVPVQKWNIPPRILQEGNARGIKIRDINGKVYNP
jgi:hypothetical protein